MPTKANLRVVGAAECQALRKMPMVPPGCPGTLDALRPQPKPFLFSDYTQWQCPRSQGSL